jgi:hypothetical protein
MEEFELFIIVTVKNNNRHVHHIQNRRNQYNECNGATVLDTATPVKIIYLNS